MTAEVYRCEPSGQYVLVVMLDDGQRYVTDDRFATLEELRAAAPRMLADAARQFGVEGIGAWQKRPGSLP